MRQRRPAPLRTSVSDRSGSPERSEDLFYDSCKEDVKFFQALGTPNDREGGGPPPPSSFVVRQVYPWQVALQQSLRPFLPDPEG
jgi:hypothetical protein